ncbi:ISNCY family transposase [Sulfurisphaera ohwakuensis]|uniref:ISNCY family transposase n=1 Tax=Sulfurisphaera ohwakuensis TaxID=69656 RepID=A0A650CG47_SULOH|nr:ISNCY family transposase [Sulfurisphaera ohwakuensis]QGR16782.1 ISNCY family transposase [Sulfurisphaera ohwakuensis]
MNTNSLLQAYYNALQEALQQIFTALTSLRKDTLAKLVLGGVMGGTATEIAQATGMDYETVLKNLNKLANTNLIKIVKEIVQDHPVQLIIDDTHDHKQHARALPVSRNGAQVFYCREHKRYEPTIQLLIIAIKDLKTNETYIVTIIPYIPQKVVEILRERGEEVEFKTKIQEYLETLPILEKEFNVVCKVFDSWYVNSRTLLSNTVGELKSNSRVTEGGRLVPVGEFPEGEYLVEYLGIPIKLLVIDDYKGFGRRYFFSTNVNDTAEDIITAWENRWDIEVLIRELKALGLEKGSFLTWVRNKGFITLKALSLLLVLLFKYSLGLYLGAKRIARVIKSIYQSLGGIKKLFKRRKKT